MIESKYIELMNKEIDGLNSPKESAELKTFLEKDPDAQRYYRNLLELAGSLEGVEEIEPSPELKKAILNSIDWEKYSIKNKKIEPKFGNPKLKFNIKYAYVFAFGLILGIISYSYFSGSIKQTDTSLLTGTMLNLKDAKIVDRCNFQNEQVTCSLRLKSQDKYVFAELDLNSKQLIQVSLEFNNNDLVFKGVQNLNENTVNFNANEKSINFIQKGVNRFTILLINRSGMKFPLVFSISSGGRQLFEKSLSLER